MLHLLNATFNLQLATCNKAHGPVL